MVRVSTVAAQAATVATAFACLDAAAAFAPLSSLPGTSAVTRQNAATPLALRAHADDLNGPAVDRRAVLRLAILAAGPMVLSHQPVFAEDAKKSKKQLDEEYEEDLSSMRKV
jgi:hypothetical protein